MKVKVIWEFEADIEDLDQEFVDIPELAKELARKELEDRLEHDDITADDFEYTTD